MRRRRGVNGREVDMFREVLKFWFEEIEPKMWWIADDTFDSEIRRRFSALHERAIHGELFEWRTEPQGRLAEIIVLDQFSRNMYRHTPEAFAYDAIALVLAQEAIALGTPAALTPVERSFLYMPLQHSESPMMHEWAVRLFRENGIAENYNFELKHKAIIDRFGRYPHRNDILGRASSAEEIEFLKQPNSSF
jgi:uncharacterized protein (DUF924 family)